MASAKQALGDAGPMMHAVADVSEADPHVMVNAIRHRHRRQMPRIPWANASA